MKLTKALKKGATVKVIAGKDKGKTGKVLRVNKAANKVLVDGINLYKKHRKPRKQGQKGEIITIPRPMDISNLRLEKDK
ncbi:MAG: 50S ribosomal protein L24 [bacterium]|nr:50S ribosomal protein L24 [bacterium]